MAAATSFDSRTLSPVMGDVSANDPTLENLALGLPGLKKSPLASPAPGLKEATVGKFSTRIKETPAGKASGGHVPDAFIISRREHLETFGYHLKRYLA